MSRYPEGRRPAPKPPLPVRLRPALACDAELLTRIAHESKRYWGYPERYMSLWRDGLTFSPAYLEAPGHMAAVAEIPDPVRAVGFCALADTRDGQVELDGLFGLPEAIGRGVGAALFRHACDQARRAGFRAMSIVADPNAREFYVRYGARPGGWVASLPAGRRLPLLILNLL